MKGEHEIVNKVKYMQESVRADLIISLFLTEEISAKRDNQ